MSSQVRKEVVAHLSRRHKLSERRACELAMVHRSTYRYKSRRKSEDKLKRRIYFIANKHPRYGYRRVYAVIRKEGSRINHKKIYRLYKEMNLAHRIKRKKRLNLSKGPLATPQKINELWAMDFMSDKLENGHKIRTLNIIDVFSRECLQIKANRSLPSKEVIKTLEELKKKRGLPKVITLDNGPEYISKALKKWSLATKVILDHIPPGKPTQNAYIESFNGKFRDEFLNQNSFKTIKEVQVLVEDWCRYYNKERPHSSLNYKTPEEFAKKNCSYVHRQAANMMNSRKKKKLK